jgi:SNF2-related domain
MRYRAHVLHSLLRGFVQRRSHEVLQTTLPQKNEYVMLVRMTAFQKKLYSVFMDEVVRKKAVPNPLKAFSVCCKIWNHPDVLYNFLKKREADLEIELEEQAAIDQATAAGEPPPAKKRGRKTSPKKGANLAAAKKITGAQSAVSKDGKMIPAATINPSTNTTVSAAGTATPIVTTASSQPAGAFNDCQVKTESQGAAGPAAANNYSNVQSLSQPSAANNQQQMYQYSSSGYSGYGNSYDQSSYGQCNSNSNYYGDGSGGYGYMANGGYGYPGYGDTNYPNYQQQPGQNYWSNNGNNGYYNSQAPGNQQCYDQNAYPGYPGSSGGNYSGYEGQGYGGSGYQQTNYLTPQQQAMKANNKPPYQPYQTAGPNAYNAAGQPTNYGSQQPYYNAPVPAEVKPKIEPVDQTAEVAPKIEEKPVVEEKVVPTEPVKAEPMTEPVETEVKVKTEATDTDKKSDETDDTTTKDEKTDNADLPIELLDDKDLAVADKEPTKSSKDDGIPYEWAVELMKNYIPDLLENSPKFEIFFCILEESVRLGDRMLLFSQSLLTLNLIEKFLQKRKIVDTEKFWAKNESYFSEFDGVRGFEEFETDFFSLFLKDWMGQQQPRTVRSLSTSSIPMLMCFCFWFRRGPVL